MDVFVTDAFVERVQATELTGFNFVEASSNSED